MGLTNGLTYDDRSCERRLQWDKIEKDEVYKEDTVPPTFSTTSISSHNISELFNHTHFHLHLQKLNDKVKMLTLPIILSILPLSLAAPVNEPRAVNALALDAKGVDFIAGFEGFRPNFYTDAAVRCTCIPA